MKLPAWNLAFRDEHATVAFACYLLSVQVSARSGRPTCVRCRVFVQGSTRITLTKNGDRVPRSTSTMLLDRHLNVADGALSELTVNFIRPSAAVDDALYSCTTGADHQQHRQTTVTFFRLTVLP